RRPDLAAADEDEAIALRRCGRGFARTEIARLLLADAERQYLLHQRTFGAARRIDRAAALQAAPAGVEQGRATVGPGQMIELIAIVLVVLGQRAGRVGTVGLSFRQDDVAGAIFVRNPDDAAIEGRGG